MAKAELDVQTIFNRAVELEEGQVRLEFLEEACAGDSAIRDRVDALLRAHSEAGNFFAGAPQCDVTTLSQEGSALLGSHVVPYKLLEQIGEGGINKSKVELGDQIL